MYLFSQGVLDLDIEEAGIKYGLNILNQACMDHILNGLTTIDEFVRVLGVVNEQEK